MSEPLVIGVRHGEVDNPDGVVYSGLPGFGLSERGRGQAAGVAQVLAARPPTALYTSPLERATETAAAVSRAAGIEASADERLHEWRHWQRWAGMTWREVRERGGEEWERYRRDPGSVTAGESLAELADRVQSWLNDVRERHTDGVVVAVSHLEPLRAILLRLTDRPARDLFEIRIGLAEAVRIWPEPDPSVQPIEALLGG